MARERAFAYQEGLEGFLRLIERAQADLHAEVLEAILNEKLRTRRQRAAQLAKVVALMDELGAKVDPAARELAAAAVTQSSDRTLQQVRGLGITAPAPPSFAGIQRDAIRALQDQMTGRLVAARQQIGRRVEDLYARAGREAAVRALLGADGSSKAAASKLSQRLLQDRGVRRLVEESGVGFVDSAGRGWKLDTYSRMVVRTVTREAVVQGSLLRMAAHGITVARVSQHASACSICTPYEGRLISLDGSTGEHLGEAVSSGLPLPPYHPNCGHTLSPVSLGIDELRAKNAPEDDAGQQMGDVLQAQTPVAAVTARGRAAIESVHRTDGLHGVAVRPLTGGSANVRGSYNPANHEIRVRLSGPHPELTLAHEIGHMLDHLQLDGPGLTSSAAGQQLEAWRAAVELTGAVDGLRDQYAAATSQTAKNFFKYLLSPVELFARSYAQYIALRSGDELLATQLALALETPYRQWEADDFEAVAQAFDDLFSDLGLA